MTCAKSNASTAVNQPPKSGYGFLAAILDSLEDQALLHALQGRRNGRPGYPVRAMWRAYLSKFILKIRFNNQLLERMRGSRKLREVCGFGDDVPSESALSRFVSRLADYADLVERCFTGITGPVEEAGPQGQEEARQAGPTPAAPWARLRPWTRPCLRPTAIPTARWSATRTPDGVSSIVPGQRKAPRNGASGTRCTWFPTPLTASPWAIRSPRPTPVIPRNCLSWFGRSWAITPGSSQGLCWRTGDTTASQSQVPVRPGHHPGHSHKEAHRQGRPVRRHLQRRGEARLPGERPDGTTCGRTKRPGITFSGVRPKAAR